MITIKNFENRKEKKGVVLNDVPSGTTFTGGLERDDGSVAWGLWLKPRPGRTRFSDGISTVRVPVLAVCLTPNSNGDKNCHSVFDVCKEIINFKEVEVEITIKEKE